MKFSKTASVPEHELTQYLLGKLRGQECERLDELSIADDEFAERLRAVENDLIDAYVRRQLRGNALRDFESRYLASDGRRQKVAMARTLYLAGSKLDSTADSELSVAQPNAFAAVSPRSPARLPRQRFAWFAVAAVLVLAVTTSWLAVENGRLRQQDRISRAAFGSLAQELRQLHAQVESLQNSKAAGTGGNVPRVVDDPARLISSIFLLPPTRGASTIPVASVTRRDQWLRLQLALDADNFSDYQVDLMDLETNKYVWHSGRVKSADVNRRRALSSLLPLAPLKTQRYAAEVSGIAADGRHEEVGSYVFRIAQAASPKDERR